MLLLVVHTVEAVTAKVPLSMIMLNDHSKRRAIPAELKLRMVLPTSGMNSISLWDSPDVQTLQAWIEENLGADCTSEISEVQEDFMTGFNLELARLRTAERVAASSQRTLETVGNKTVQAAEFVGAATGQAVTSAKQKLENLDQRTGVITAAKSTTTEAIKTVKGVSDKVMQSEAVNTVVTNVGAAAATGWKRVGFGISWVSEQIVSSKRTGQSGEEAAANTEDTAKLFAVTSIGSQPVPASETAQPSQPLPTSASVPAKTQSHSDTALLSS